MRGSARTHSVRTTLALAAGVSGLLCAALGTGIASAAAGVGAAAGEPNASQLKAALLSQQDLGPGYTLVPTSTPSPGSGGGSAVAGCPQLSGLLNATTSGGQTVASETYQGGQTGPFLSEALRTAPGSTPHTDDAHDKAALTSCKSMTVNAGGAPLKLSMTPTDLGVAGSTAVRLTGSFEGVQISGDLAVDQVGQVELGYLFLQIDDASQQQAVAVFKQADAKVHQAFGTAASGSSV